jgi:hypothetical protein
MKSQGWCGEARLQVSKEVAANRRLTKDGGVISATGFACRDEVFRLGRKDNSMRGDGGDGDGDEREGEKVGKERVDAHV